MRNVAEHSRSEYIWLAAQFWPDKGKCIEVSIMDECVGIYKTLSENPKY